MKGTAAYQIYKEIKRGETAIVNDEAKADETMEHTKGFLDCMFYLKEMTIEERNVSEDYIGLLYLEIESRKREKQSVVGGTGT